MTSSPQTSNEENMLNYEVSDEILESAAMKENAGNYTLAHCTGLSTCPA